MGTGIDKDEVKAVEWLKLAAAQGNAMAQCGLAACFAEGTGVDKDAGKTAKLLKLAAAQGNADAQAVLGFYFAEGRSVNNDSWISKHTVKLMDWDHDAMHHSRFNIMRFYIPHLSAFAGLERLLFMDDDVILTGDLRLLGDAVVPEEAVLVGQCDNFAWQDQCSRYVPFVHGKDWRTNSATLYLQQNLTNQHQHCPWADRALCGPSVEEHTALLLQLYAEQNDGAVLDFAEQPVWNFGLVRDSPWP